MKLYLAGPMRGLPELNFPTFFAVAERLRVKGHEVFNPAEHQENPFSIRRALKLDLSWICDHAEAVAFLSGWESSKGARAEHALATALDLTIIYIGGSYGHN